MFVDIDAGDGQRVGGQIGAGHLDFRVGHGGQACQRAVAGAQVQHVLGFVAQEVVNGAIGQQLCNKAARHDGALVHIKRHAHQPCLVGQIRGRFAGVDAFFKKRSYLRLLLGRYRLIFYRIFIIAQGGVNRQAQLPQHQPDGFFFGIGRTVAKANASLSQARGAGGDEGAHSGAMGQGVSVAHAAAPSVAAAACSLACRCSSMRR